MNASDVIVIYPGRFHPFHKGHKGVYDLLSSKFKNVYIATSDKVEANKSPFSFDEKVKIMGITGVPDSAILKVKQTYNGNEYIGRFNNNYALIFAVSEKDMLDDPRFNFPASGMSLKKNGEPAYLQKFTSMDKIDNMVDHGYIMTVPTTSFKVNGHDVNSASQIRSLLGSENVDDAKQAFVDLYDKYNETVFNMIRNKLGNKTMENIDLNELRRMAGLNEISIDKDEDYSDVPGYKEKPMFDQLGKIIDSYEMSQDGSDDIKNPLSTVKTDDGEQLEITVGEARALKQMMEMLSSARKGEVKSAREKFLDTIQKAEGLHSMLEFARSKGLVEEGDMEEGNAFSGPQVGLKKGDKFQVKGKGKTFTKEDEIEELDLNDIRADFGVEEGKMKDVAMDMADAFYDKVSAMVDQNNDIGQSVIDAWDDADENPPEWSLDDEARQILIDAGKIGPDQDEDLNIRAPKEESKMVPGFIGADGKATSTPTQADMDANAEFQHMKKLAGLDTEEDEDDVEEAAKPDYIDLDGDGDRVESMRQAAKDKANKRDESLDPQSEERASELVTNCCEAPVHQDPASPEAGDHSRCTKCHEMAQVIDLEHEGDTEMPEEQDMDRMRELAGMPAITETAYWNWDEGSYDEEAGYDENFHLWSQEAQSSRSKNGDEPFKSKQEMIDVFDAQLEKYNINTFKQKQLSQMKADQKAKADREMFQTTPKQQTMDI